MEKVCLDSSVAIIGIKKNDCLYGMACAWCMQVDYDKILMLLGSQSETGKILKKGDLVGVSALNKNQIEISNKLGSKHSGKVNKFEGVDIDIDGSIILVKGASRMMKAKVLDIIHLEGVEEDNLVYLKILENIKNDDNFLNYSNYLK